MRNVRPMTFGSLPKRRDQSKQHLPKAKAQERAKANAAAEAVAAETPAE